MAGTNDVVIPAFTDKELTVKGDAELLPQNIRNGINLFGVVGTMEEGLTGIDFGTVTLYGTQLELIVSHNLGKIPTFACIVKKYETFSPNDIQGVHLNCNKGVFLYHSVANGWHIEDKHYGAKCNVSVDKITFINGEHDYEWSTQEVGYQGTYYWFAIA